MNIIARVLDALKPPPEQVEVKECPVAGEHRWLRGGTHTHPDRRVCLECGLQEGNE